MRGSNTSEIVFEDVKVPGESISILSVYHQDSSILSVYYSIFSVISCILPAEIVFICTSSWDSAYLSILDLYSPVYFSNLLYTPMQLRMSWGMSTRECMYWWVDWTMNGVSCRLVLWGSCRHVLILPSPTCTRGYSLTRRLENFRWERCIVPPTSLGGVAPMVCPDNTGAYW